MFTKHLQDIIKQNVMFLHFFESASHLAAFLAGTGRCIYLPAFFSAAKDPSKSTNVSQAFLFVHHELA